MVVALERSPFNRGVLEVLLSYIPDIEKHMWVPMRASYILWAGNGETNQSSTFLLHRLVTGSGSSVHPARPPFHPHCSIHAGFCEICHKRGAKQLLLEKSAHIVLPFLPMKAYPKWLSKRTVNGLITLTAFGRTRSNERFGVGVCMAVCTSTR